MLLNNGVVIRAIENLGLNTDIAYKMKAHGKSHLTGSFILYRFDARPDVPNFVGKELRRDIDVVKSKFTAFLLE